MAVAAVAGVARGGPADWASMPHRRPSPINALEFSASKPACLGFDVHGVP